MKFILLLISSLKDEKKFKAYRLIFSRLSSFVRKEVQQPISLRSVLNLLWGILLAFAMLAVVLMSPTYGF